MKTKIYGPRGTSTRYCPICERPTLYKYDRTIFHSACTNCGHHGKGSKYIEIKEAKNGKTNNKCISYRKKKDT